MQHGDTRLFLPGFGARAASYAEGLPDGWEPLQPPPLTATRGRLAPLVAWAAAEVARRPGPATLAGHSMGAALAILVAARYPAHVAGLVLVSPAGLPLTKPVRSSVAALVRQLVTGTYRAGDAASSAAELATAPRSAARLVRTLRHLDLHDEMTRVRARGTPVSVIGCVSDTLTTPRHCREAAELLGGSYRELELEGGHVWMFGRWSTFASTLDSANRAQAVSAW